tara:strand:- start:636 stop:881 length:246 start_codon:yes stop_codon:yes gene_type:complete
VVNITIKKVRVKPRVAQAMRRNSLEIEEFSSGLSPGLCLEGTVLDGGTNERFLFRVAPDLALVIANNEEEGLVAIGTTSFL